MQLFGTDGIRGRLASNPSDDVAAIEALFSHREISPRLFRLIGEGLGAMMEHGTEVVIGWDQRPGNSALVSALTQGFHLRGIVVIWAGEVATPGLQASMLHQGAVMGCMVTASHNPVTDSGIKVFDQYGYKSMPEYEAQVSDIIAQLAREEREVDEPELLRLAIPDSEFDGGSVHREMLERRFSLFENCFAGNAGSHPHGNISSLPDGGLAIDASGGSAGGWLVDWLNAKGIEAHAVASPVAMNANCGAGEFSPSDKWTWEQLQSYTGEHLLLTHLAQRCRDGMPNDWQVGNMVAAALDGDGDRCLLIEVTPTGLQIFDGDRMADTLLRAGGESWRLAASIEVDLGLAVDIQTAVGDRWLSTALSPPSSQSERLLLGVETPQVIGCEDSGHLVMAAPHPRLDNHWSLVGDGIASLLALLAAQRGLSGISDDGFVRGWKRRISVTGVDRLRWDGKNAIADLVEELARREISSWGAVEDWRRTDITGETSLLLLESKVDGFLMSVGIRNSGTEAKTNVSIRLAPQIMGLSDNALILLGEIEAVLQRELVV
jgi:phosphomannomutase